MSTPISEVKSKTVFFGNVNTNGKAQEVQNKDSFSGIFDKTQGSAKTPKKETAVKIKDTDSIQHHANIQKNKTSEQLKEQTKEVKGMKTEEDVEAATVEAANEMVEKIAETFDINVEEVEDVLETLGLTALDLLNAENLTKVVLALNPECDAMTLMTNEELFADLKGLMNMAQELKNQIAQNFNLSEEEMTAVLNSMMEKAEVQVPAENVAQETTQLSEAVTEAASDTVGIEVDVVEVARTDSTAYGGTVIPKTETSQDIHDNSAKEGEESGNAAGQQFSQNFVNQLAEAVENASGETTSYGVRGQDIINQITEHIRVHVKQDTTEMELQLHPASLGNVKVQLTSAGGVLTAVFTTENEAVKAALESQLIQLKENFAQQGLKVESVEVNVSAQGFERSLDQQEQEQNRFEDNRSRSKKGSRRIRLSGMEDAEDILAEDMAADDRIVADMMIRNGNTVDYTV